MLSSTLAASLMLAATAAPSVPPGFQLQEVGPSGTWVAPVGVASAPDGRLFVIERRGLVHIIQGNVKLAEPFLDLQDEVLNERDRGMLGIALDPSFSTNHYVYLLYTVDPEGDGVDAPIESYGRLVRYTESSSSPGTADPASRLILLGHNWSDGPPILSPTHTIGCLRFAQDGSLFVSAGDGANPDRVDSGGLDPAAFGPGMLDPLEDIGSFRSQWLGSLAGKILRLDPATGLGLPSNPFWTGNAADHASRVWVYGVRNAFRIVVRPGTSGPGELWFGDVGWNTYEEVNRAVPVGGQNFGWPCREGPVARSDYAGSSPAHHGCGTIGTSENPALPTSPALYWHHSNPALSDPPDAYGRAASAIGFYSGTRYPAEHRGACFYADFEGSWIRFFHPDESPLHAHDFGLGFEGTVDIVSDPATGDLYIVTILDHRIRRLIYDASNQGPTAAGSAVPTTGTVPLAVHFSSAGSSDPDGDPFTTTWTFGDGAISLDAEADHTYQEPGEYGAVLTVEDGRGGQSSKVFDILVDPPGGSNTRPVPQILAPADGSTFLGRADVELLGTATDLETPTAELDYSWELILHHNTHIHPGWFAFTGPSASFLPGEHDDGTGIWFEVVLRVKDGGNLSASTRINIYPDDGSLIIDDDDSRTSRVGTWSTSGGVLPYGARSLYSNTAGNTFSYTAALVPGDYKVYGWWSTYSSRTTVAPYAVTHAGGSDTVLKDQRSFDFANRWNLLGTYTFGTVGRVTITAVGNGKSTCADAVAFLATQAIEAPPVAHIVSIAPSPASTGQDVTFTGSSEGTVTGYEWRSSLDGILSNTVTFSTALLAVGTHDIFFRIKDRNGLWADEDSQSLVVSDPPVGGEHILDDGEPGTSFTGSWPVSGGPGPYGDRSLYAKSAGSVYTFAFTVPAGEYDVDAWWTPWSSRSAVAPYTIVHSGGSSVVTKDQRSGGSAWTLLGRYTFGSSAIVRVSSTGDGKTVCADAIRLRAAGGPPPPPPPPSTDIVLDNGQPGTTSTGNWRVSGGTNPYGANSLYAKGDSGVYTFTLPVPEPGQYQVLAWWTDWPSRSSSVDHAIVHATGTAVVPVDQRTNGGDWRLLGAYTFGAQARIEVRARPDGKTYCADAVCLRKVATP